jgi:hypothetical protein
MPTARLIRWQPGGFVVDRQIVGSREIYTRPATKYSRKASPHLERDQVGTDGRRGAL